MKEKWRHPLQPRVNPRGTHLPRFEAIRPWVEGRSVLDIGAACGFRRPDWLHRLVDDVARETLAIDILPEPVAALKAEGFEAEVGDAEDLHLDRKFDCVLAGELIEHISNHRGFFDSVRRHLDPGGVVVITTPNAFAFMNFFYRLGKKPAPINADHTVIFDADTLTRLMRGCDFEVLHLGYLEHETPGRIRALIARVVRAFLPDRLAWNTLIVVGRPT